MLFQGDIPSIIRPTTKCDSQHRSVNNYPPDKKSVYLIPLSTHPPRQQIKLQKDSNKKSALQIMAAE